MVSERRVYRAESVPIGRNRMSANDVTLERTMPNSIESERAVLGAILLDGKAIFPATEVLTIEDFYLETHREIFRAILALAGEETSIDLFTFREELRQRNKEEAAGGTAYLASLTDGLPRGLNVGYYARTVREKTTSRLLIKLSIERIVELAAEFPPPPAGEGGAHASHNFR
jgi:replicative DNA helicase